MEISNIIDTFKPSFFNASNDPYKDDKLYINLLEDSIKADLETNTAFKFPLSKRGDSFGQFFDIHCMLTYQYLHMYEDKNYENYIGS